MKTSWIRRNTTIGWRLGSSRRLTWKNWLLASMLTRGIASSVKQIHTTIRNSGDWLLFVALLPVLLVVLIVTYEPEPND